MRRPRFFTLYSSAPGWLEFTAFFLLLAAPYLLFVYSNNFIFEFANVYAIALFAAAALAFFLVLKTFPNRPVKTALFAVAVVLFLDVRNEIFNALEGSAAVIIVILTAFWVLHRHLEKILLAVFATIIVASLVIIEPSPRTVVAAEPPSEAVQPVQPRPIYVHLVLDEQIGVEGFSEDIPNQKMMKAEIKTWAAQFGFRVFGRAYSQHFDSNDSIYSMLNFDAGNDSSNWYTYNERRRTHAAVANKYFELMSQRGYNIRAYQASFMDFCANQGSIVDACFTYRLPAASSAALAELGSWEKLDVILALYWQRSYLKERVRTLYTAARDLTAIGRRNLPNWPSLRQVRITPVAALPVFDRLIEDVATAPPGTLFFAHLLIPHHPYALDANCTIRRPLLQWNARFPPPQLGNHAERAAAREARRKLYDEYIEQYRCTLRKLTQLFEAMKARGTFADATIVLHGDHGSRITRTDPRIGREDRLRPQDYIDSFSTLFAIKSPHIEPGYDLRMAPLAILLENSVNGRLDDMAAPNTHRVYLRDEQKPIRIERPMPEFPLRRPGEQGAPTTP